MHHLYLPAASPTSCPLLTAWHPQGDIRWLVQLCLAGGSVSVWVKGHGGAEPADLVGEKPVQSRCILTDEASGQSRAWCSSSRVRIFTLCRESALNTLRLQWVRPRWCGQVRSSPPSLPPSLPPSSPPSLLWCAVGFMAARPHCFRSQWVVGCFPWHVILTVLLRVNHFWLYPAVSQPW